MASAAAPAVACKEGLRGCAPPCRPAAALPLPTLHPNAAVANSLFAVLCWGDNSRGQGGTGSTGFLQEPAPALLNASGKPVQVEAGDGMTCALTDAGELYCWGLYDAATTTGSLLPVLIEPPKARSSPVPLGAVVGGVIAGGERRRRGTCKGAFQALCPNSILICPARGSYLPCLAVVLLAAAAAFLWYRRRRRQAAEQLERGSPAKQTESTDKGLDCSSTEKWSGTDVEQPGFGGPKVAGILGR